MSGVLDCVFLSVAGEFISPGSFTQHGLLCSRRVFYVMDERY